MVQKGKKVKRYKRYRFTDGDMTVKKIFFFGFTAWEYAFAPRCLL